MMQERGGKSRWKDIGKTAADTAITGLKAVLSPSIDLDTYIMEFPYMMYYRLQSCTTLNVYELPYTG